MKAIYTDGIYLNGLGQMILINMCKTCFYRALKQNYHIIMYMYRILTEFKVFMDWKDPPRANRDAEPRSGEALRFAAAAGLSST